MNHTLTAIDRQKRDDFMAKKNDITNKLQSQELQNELQQKQVRFQMAAKDEQRNYAENLNYQAQDRSEAWQQDKHAHKQQEAHSKGFEFECYTRDKVVHAEKQQIKHYQKGQIDGDQWKKQVETEDSKIPSSTLMSTQELQSIKATAAKEDWERRQQANSLMKEQAEQAEWSKRTAADKFKREQEQEAQKMREAAWAAEQKEKLQYQEQKRDYNTHLQSQIGEDQWRKQAEDRVRRF